MVDFVFIFWIGWFEFQISILPRHRDADDIAPLAGGKILSRNSSRSVALAGSMAGNSKRGGCHSQIPGNWRQRQKQSGFG
jgi:hypothetical protein